MILSNGNKKSHIVFWGVTRKKGKRYFYRTSSLNALDTNHVMPLTQGHLYATIQENKEKEVDKMTFRILIKSSAILSAV